jgi:hypothetical protein
MDPNEEARWADEQATAAQVAAEDNHEHGPYTPELAWLAAEVRALRLQLAAA